MKKCLKWMITFFLLLLGVSVAGCQKSVKTDGSNHQIMRKYGKIHFKEIADGDFKSLMGDWKEVATSKGKEKGSTWSTKNLDDTIEIKKDTIIIRSKKGISGTHKIIIRSSKKYKDGNMPEAVIDSSDRVFTTPLDGPVDARLEIYPAGEDLYGGGGVSMWGHIPNVIKPSRDQIMIASPGEDEYEGTLIFQR